MSISEVFIEAELRPEFERATSIELVDSDEVLEPDPGTGKESSEPGPDPQTGKEASEPEPTGKESSEADPATETADTGYVESASERDLNRPIM